MDWSAISGITTSIAAARDIAKGMSALRDSSLINERTAALMDQLLKAQEGLLAHNTTLLQLQSDLSKLQKENLELKAALDERGKYTLVKLPSGEFALRSNPTHSQPRSGTPSVDETAHYICQPCFVGGKAIVLRRSTIMGIDNGMVCPICKSQVFDE